MKLKKIVEKVIDNRGKTPPLVDNGYELLEVNAVNESSRTPDYQKVRKFVSKDTYENWFRTGNITYNDILIPTVGTIGGCCISKQERGSIAQNLIALRINKQIADPDYIFYYFRTSFFKKELLNLDIGGVQPSIKVPHLLNLEISLPPLSEQKRISSILSSFDNKIEQLKKENNILEDIAQSIFKEWFVKYNFPNKDGKPYKDNNGKMINSELGLIPEGWRVTTYGEMEDLKNGINYSRDEHGDTVCKIINTRDIVETNYITDQNLEKINIDKEKAEKYIIDENDILIIRSASPGKVAVVQNPSGMIIYSGFIIRLSPKDINTKWYLYEDLKEKGPKLTKYSESSVMKNINQQIINNTKVIIPSTKILNKYHTIANNIHEKIWNNTLETFNVKKSKNAALNKLIK